MTDLWGGLDADSIEDDPFNIPDDKHPCYVSDCHIRESKNTKKLGLTIVYKITDGKASGSQVQDWFQVGPITAEEGTEDYTKQLRGRSFLKKRLIELGIPASKMQNIEPNDLIGITGLVQTKKREQSVNVVGFTLKDDASGSGGSVIPAGNRFANLKS